MAGVAEVVRAFLIGHKIVVDPAPTDQVPPFQLPGDGTVFCYVSSIPDEIDQAVCLRDVPGVTWAAKMQPSVNNVPKRVSHPGVKVLVRWTDYTGYDVAQTVANACQAIYNGTVQVRGISYAVQSIYRIGDITDAGEEIGKKRQLWTFMLRVAFQDSQPNIG